jgi:hypothetical protein
MQAFEMLDAAAGSGMSLEHAVSMQAHQRMR